MTIGDGNAIVPSAKCTIRGQVIDKNDSLTQKVVMAEVTCSRSAKFNLFRITTRIKKGWILSRTKENLTLTKGIRNVVLDVKINTPKGVLFSIRIKRIDAKEVALKPLMKAIKCYSRWPQLPKRA